MTPERPVLRYFGGKWRIAPWILEHLPEHRIYVESFGGGASVLMRKPRSNGEVYNDLDGEVVNVFRVLQRNHRRFKRLMEVTPFARDEMELSYGRVKDPVERARRTVIRSFMGFGADSVTRNSRTGFRNNKGGTSPAHDWANWPWQIDIFHARMADVVIENRDACEVMASQDSPDTLHYVDPPYPMSTRSDGSCSHGYRFEMTDQEHEGLATFLTELKGMVVISGYPHPIYEALGWASSRMDARTFHKNNRSSPRIEVIWMNPAAVAAKNQMEMFA